MCAPAGDLERMPHRASDGQHWLVSWHPPDDLPSGRPHGAAGVCVAGDRLVLISPDGTHWGFPGGRPEGEETFEETLRREMWEEACVRVTTARLLGYACGECVAGQQEGLVQYRSFWRADVEILPWQPLFEIPHRRVVPAARARDHLREFTDADTRISLRALTEAGL